MEAYKNIEKTSNFDNPMTLHLHLEHLRPMIRGYITSVVIDELQCYDLSTTLYT